MGSIDPFMVYFDSRWVRKLSARSLAHRRYLEHVMQQAESVLTTQRVGVLFATPPMLTALGRRLSREVRESVHDGMHLGGLPSTVDYLNALTNDWFPNAAVLCGYGNGLVGMCPQLSTSPEGAPEYFPHGNRLVFNVLAGRGETRCQAVFHRLDLSRFLANVHERDEVERIAPDDRMLADGFNTAGLRDPRPPVTKDVEARTALY
jgi:hypothetical protein